MALVAIPDGVTSSSNPTPGAFGSGVWLVHQDKQGFETYEFPVGVEGSTLDEPNRSSVTQGLGALFLLHLGEGIKSIQLRGTTGYRPMSRAGRYGQAGTVLGRSRVPNQLEGFKAWKQLEDLYTRYNLAFSNGDIATWALYFNNPAGAGSYQVHPMALQETRDRSRSLLHGFSIQLVILLDLTRGGDNAAGSALIALEDAANAAAQQDLNNRLDAVDQAFRIAPPPSVSYLVKSGDTAASIAAIFKGAPGQSTTPEAIMSANSGILNTITGINTSLPPGIVLVVPMTELQP